jgi:hypothetical protein
MCECSGKNSDSHPYCSARRPSSAGVGVTSVGKTPIPNFKAQPLFLDRDAGLVIAGVTMTDIADW